MTRSVFDHRSKASQKSHSFSEFLVRLFSNRKSTIWANTARGIQCVFNYHFFFQLLGYASMFATRKTILLRKFIPFLLIVRQYVVRLFFKSHLSVSNSSISCGFFHSRSYCRFYRLCCGYSKNFFISTWIDVMRCAYK